MIEKIISIKNFGPFANYNSGQGWNGTFSKNNVIYAPNGSGKTSLSLIFESLRGSPHLINKKNLYLLKKIRIYILEEKIKHTNLITVIGIILFRKLLFLIAII